MSAELARSIIDGNVFMTLGTVDEHGRPWTSPVFFATDDRVDFYWISAPDAAHSVNLVRRPDASAVIFNSQARPNTGTVQAVYLSGEASEVTGPDFDRGLEIYPGPPERGARVIPAESLRPPGPWRLYRVRASAHWILCPRQAGQPCAPHGKAHDHRLSATL